MLRREPLLGPSRLRVEAYVDKTAQRLVIAAVFHPASQSAGARLDTDFDAAPERDFREDQGGPLANRLQVAVNGRGMGRALPGDGNKFRAQVGVGTKAIAHIP
jgi:hypothetical protein